ncbi:hypothetical protein B0H21DRAFT_895409 [Amylocystis lapponica]|nr:hypothetical protein B0H21DRAFT_895409 [Amylocystis lapponica]
MRYLHLGMTESCSEVKLRVAQSGPDIWLYDNRLYMHEYATSPPLDELRISIVTADDEEGVLVQGDVAFCIRNAKGVTLGNFWKGLYNFFLQEPDPVDIMHLAGNIRLEGYTIIPAREAVHAARTS